MTTKTGKTVYLQAVTVIDPAMGWIAICIVSSSQEDLLSNIVELAWLTRYPLPDKVIVDRGNESLAEFKTMILADCGIEIMSIASRNPQANSILERVHQTIGNIIRTFKVQDMGLDDESHWDGILASIMFTLRATVHTTSQWQVIRKHKQGLIHKGNQQENRNRKEHTYNKGGKVLLKNVVQTKFNQDARLGP